MKFPKVKMIMLHQDNWPVLEECLNSLMKKTDYPNYELYLLANGSPKENIEKIQNSFAWANLTISKINLGFSKGNNLLIKKLFDPNENCFYLLLNDDLVFKNKTWLSQMVKTMQEDQNIGIVGAKLLFPNGRLQHVGGELKLSNLTALGHWHRLYNQPNFEELEPQEMDFVTGAVLLIKNEVIDQIGLLDEGFSPVCYEDIDYNLRARKAGYKIVYEPRAQIVHMMHGSRKKFPKSWQYFVKRKSFNRFAGLNFPWWWCIARIMYWPEDIKYLFYNEGGDWRENWREYLSLFAKAYWVTYRNWWEILNKRINRKQRIWY